MGSIECVWVNNYSDLLASERLDLGEHFSALVGQEISRNNALCKLLLFRSCGVRICFRKLLDSGIMPVLHPYPEHDKDREKDGKCFF